LGGQEVLSRLFANVSISARIKELKAEIASHVVAAAVRRRSWRVQILQARVDKMLALSESRAKMYADSKSEGHRFQVQDDAERQIAIEEGCTILELPPELPPPGADWKDAPPPPRAEYPKTMVHPGYSVGGETGLLMKDFRGKDANQEVWKFDAALESKIMECLKQAAIEEGQWNQKREISGNAGIELARIELRREARRISDAKKAALAAGQPWPPKISASRENYALSPEDIDPDAAAFAELTAKKQLYREVDRPGWTGLSHQPEQSAGAGIEGGHAKARPGLAG
jgi:hypothetical protein